MTLQEPPKRPDPATYSQKRVLAIGEIPTWNSPDIITLHPDPNGNYLLPNVRLVARNLSPEVSAVNVVAEITMSLFGIGMPHMPLATHVLSIPPSGTTGFEVALPESVYKGEPLLGLHFKLQHPYDLDPGNNEGSQAIDAIYTSVAGRNLTWMCSVRNPLPIPTTISLTTTSNPDITASVAPTVVTLAPFTQNQVKVTAMVPSSVHGGPGDAALMREVTLRGQGNGGSFLDGVTYIVLVDD